MFVFVLLCAKLQHFVAAFRSRIFSATNKCGLALSKRAILAPALFALLNTANPYLIKKAYALDVIYFEKTSLTVEPGTATVTLSPTVTQSALVSVYVWLKDGISLGINNSTLTFKQCRRLRCRHL